MKSLSGCAITLAFIGIEALFKVTAGKTAVMRIPAVCDPPSEPLARFAKFLIDDAVR